MIRVKEPAVVSGVLMTISGAFVIGALQLSATAGLVPLVVAALTSVLLILQTWMALRPANEKTAEVDSSALASRERTMLAWMAILFAGLWSVGVLMALPAYMALHLRWRAGKSWLTATFAGLATAVVLVLGVEIFLGIRLYPGVLLEWLTTR